MNQVAFIIAPLVVFKATNSVALSGLATAFIWGGRILIVYHSGKWMDQVGRRIVLLAGIIVSGLSLFLMGWGVILSWLEPFWLGLLVFGLGSGIFHQIRIAVLDMYPVERRGEGVGYLMTGSVVGSSASPLFTAMIAPLAVFIGWDIYAAVLIVSNVILAVAALFIVRIKPDTRDIGRNLQSYYPDSVIEDPPDNDNAQSASLLRSIMYFPILAGFVASSMAWAVMSMMMSLGSLILNQHQVDLTWIGIAISVHVFGMQGLSVPLGRLCDRFGRRLVIMLGGLILAAGSFLSPITSDYGIITLALFLVGVGWSAVNVATSALISDLTPVGRRGRILGANDLVIGVTSLIVPTLGGVIMGSLGFLAFGIAGLIFALPTLLIALPIRELSPGRYSS